MGFFQITLQWWQMSHHFSKMTPIMGPAATSCYQIHREAHILQSFLKYFDNFNIDVVFVTRVVFLFLVFVCLFVYISFSKNNTANSKSNALMESILCLKNISRHAHFFNTLPIALHISYVSLNTYFIPPCN